MSFDGSEFFTLAQDLAKNATGTPTEEARLRSAISRAYYASFLKSRDFWRHKKHEYVSSGGTAHGEVQDLFINSTDTTYQDVGSKLQQLYKCRRSADYDLRFNSLPSVTIACLRWAKEILAALPMLK